MNCELVTIGDDEYKRYDADNWTVILGCSEEDVYNENLITELEKAYQEYRNEIN